MQVFSVIILLLLSATISVSFELNGEYSISNRAQALQNVKGACDACCELVCSADWIELTIKVDTLKKMNVDIANIHLRDRRCTRFNYDNDYIHIKWSLGKDICGTELIVADTHAVYRNHVYLPPDPTAIIYREDFIFNVSCSYPLNMTVSFDNILFPEISTTYIQMENGGQFGVKMSVYKDISYTTPYTDPIIHLSTKSNLYVGVYISEGDRAAFSLRMTNCYSTPTNNIYESLKYGMIINSCPNPRDSTINILENGISSQGKFYIQMFKFIGDYSVVYLHCEVYLCQNRCAPDCSGIDSRSGTPKAQGHMTIGPIELSDNIPGGVSTAAFSMVTVLGLLLINIFIV